MNDDLHELRAVLDRIGETEAEIRDAVMRLEGLRRERDRLTIAASDQYPRTTVGALLGITPSRVSQIVSAARAGAA